MLRINPRTPQRDGFLLTGTYALTIVPIRDEEVRLDEPYAEYVFSPNPTDIDVEFQIPNQIQPDQEGGYYVEPNDVGVATIRLRGTTGQYPGKSAIEKVVGGNVGRQAGIMANLLGVSDRSDGYTEFMKLHNFLAKWFGQIRSQPYGWALVYTNTKDAEIFQVLPMAFSRPRASNRPLQYGYNLTLQVIEEFRMNRRNNRTSNDWLSRMNNIRNSVSRWRQAVNQAIVIMSYLSGSVVSSVLSTTMSPVKDLTNVFSNMNAGIQGLSYTANSAVLSSASSIEQFNEAAKNLWSAESTEDYLDSGGYHSPRVGSRTGALLPRSADAVVPPTRYAVGAVFSELPTVFGYATEMVNVVNPGRERTGLNPDDPFLDQYSAMVDLRIQSILASELAPLPDYSPTVDSASSSSHMHEAARSGAAGYLSGREDELSSSTLSAESYMLDGVRHPSITSTSARYYSLSYIAATVMSAWARGSDAAISPELESFRNGFMGIRNPATLSPLYRTVEVTATDTVYTLAQKWLGTWKRWYEIVLLNDLSYPYVSQHGGLNVRTPGEKVYIPSPEASVPVELVEQLLRLTRVHDRVGLQDAFLGFDIEIDHTGDAVFEKSDYAHVAGVKAFVQELGVVLEGTGGVTPVRTPGLGLKIGTKSRGARSLALWGSIIRKFLSSDERVAEVVSVTASQDGPAIYYNSVVKFQNYDTTVTIAGALRPV